MATPFTIRQVEALELMPLRARVLRVGLPPESAAYAADDQPESRHFAAFSIRREVIGTLSIFREARDPAMLKALGLIEQDHHHSYRIRGAAVEPELRGQGIALGLVEAAALDVRARGGDLLWCTVRTPVLGFWQRAGFSICGKEFDMPPNGPHFFAQRDLRAL